MKDYIPFDQSPAQPQSISESPALSPKLIPPSPRSSTLDTKETTVDSLRSKSYREVMISKDLDEHSAATAVLTKLAETTGSAKLRQFNECCTSANFAIEPETRKIRITANHCHNRWCIICQKPRFFTVSERIEEWLKTTARPTFITLTLKHSAAPLLFQLKSLTGAFRNFRFHKQIRAALSGGVWFLQITYNAARKEWHPHLHIAADCKYIAKRDLSEAWKKASGGSYIVDIKAIRDTSEVAKYVARYVSRPARLQDLTIEQGCEMVSSLQGKRTFGAFGSAKGINFRPPELDKRFRPRKLLPWSAMMNLASHLPIAALVISCWRTGIVLPKTEQIDKEIEIMLDLGESVHIETG